MERKVSVIVPIYNVEGYLERCVKSIQQQTYPSLEILLVNDGSPDRCGSMIDRFARADDRIQAIHQQNGGLSDARNTGMKHATGEYVIFVDSDDWLAPQFVETLMSRMERDNAELVQAHFYYAYDEYVLTEEVRGSVKPLNRTEGMCELLIQQRVKNFAWGKLYRRSLIEDLPFEKGKWFEDVYWMHHVMHRVTRFSICPEPLYYYTQRADSIAGGYSLKSMDLLEGMRERHIFIQQEYPELAGVSAAGVVHSHLVHHYLLSTRQQRKVSAPYRKEIRNYLTGQAEEFMILLTDPALKKEYSFFLRHPFLHVSQHVTNAVLRRLHMRPQVTPVRLERKSYQETTGRTAMG